MRARAITVSEFGDSSVLIMGATELPELGAGQALIEVAAAGVNFIDIYFRQGIYPRDLPYVPGSEGAGRVLAVAADVTDLAPGDRVAWCDLPGSYASHLVGDADRLLPVPDALSDEQAAALPLQGLTAHYLATSSYAISPGDDVLIHAGAGGVGLLLTQIAKVLGARVITTVSTRDKALLSRRAGADEVICGYDDFATVVSELTGGRGVECVYDGVGKDTFDDSLRCVARRGTLVVFGGASGQVPPLDIQRLNAAGSVTLTRPTLAHFVADRSELQTRAGQLLAWVAAGQLRLRVGGSYQLEDAARAHDDLAGRRSTGKLVLVP